MMIQVQYVMRAVVLVQADLMMKLVARIRDFLTEFLSKYLSVKPIWQEFSSF